MDPLDELLTELGIKPNLEVAAELTPPGWDDYDWPPVEPTYGPPKPTRGLLSFINGSPDDSNGGSLTREKLDEAIRRSMLAWDQDFFHGPAPDPNQALRNIQGMEPDFVIVDDLPGPEPTPAMKVAMKQWADQAIREARIKVGGFRVHNDGRITDITY